jgi:ribosomal protein S18 acetylase RimI-like enzyme
MYDPDGSCRHRDDEILALENKAFARPGESFEPNRSLWQSWIQSAYTHCLKDGDAIIGVAVATPHGERTNKIEMLFIDPDYQGCGLGSQMLTSLLTQSDIKQAFSCLDVRADRGGAIALYKKHGFIEDTEAQGSGYDRTNFIFMSRPPGV